MAVRASSGILLFFIVVFFSDKPVWASETPPAAFPYQSFINAGDHAITTPVIFPYRENDGPYPRRAALYSALLPGLGQVYNRKYYKVPVIYLAGAGIFWGITHNNDQFSELRDAYRIRDAGGIDPYHIDAPPNNNPVYTTDQLINAREFYRRNRDIFIIAMSALYVLNVVDAYVDAHLYEFEVSEQLSLHLHWNTENLLFTKDVRPFAGVILKF